MYKSCLKCIVIILSLALSVAIAQEEFSFQRTQPVVQSSAPSIVPARAATLSPQGFSNSTSSAYQKQQAKVAALAAQKMQENQAASVKPAASESISKPASAGSIPNSTSPTQNYPEASSSQTAPSSNNQQNQQSAPTQPYTGFQTQQGTDNSSSTPSKTPSSGGSWGSAIHY